MKVEEIINKVIKEEDIDLPSEREINEFINSPMWKWIVTALTLEMRQIIIELTSGKSFGTEGKETLEDIALRRGLYQAYNKVISLVEIAKDEVKLNQHKEEQK